MGGRQGQPREGPKPFLGKGCLAISLLRAGQGNLAGEGERANTGVRKLTHADWPALHSAPHAVLHAGPNGSGTESAKAWWGSGAKLVPAPQWTDPACMAAPASSNLENYS